MKRGALAGLALALVALALYPMVATGYGIRFMLQLFMWVALAESWNLISGLTGYVSFGHVAFFGTGAYAAGILIATPIIVQPQVAILGIGAITKRPAVMGDTVTVRPMAYLCLSFDHRVIDGALAGEFLGEVKTRFEGFTPPPEQG